MSRFFLLLLSFALMSACGSNPSKPRVVNYEAKGNLEVTKGGECIDLHGINNSWTPADMAASAGACIENENYAYAFDLNMIALAYGRYDAYRVADRTAHQAAQAATVEAVMRAGERRQKAMQEYAMQQMAKEGWSEPLCSRIKEMGKPNYYPRYMVQHGITAFTGRSGSGLVEDFDADAAWELVLNDYMKCEPK